jgi:hypothetical protein
MAADFHVLHRQQISCVSSIFNDGPAGEKEGYFHAVASGYSGIVHRQHCLTVASEALVARTYGLMHVSGQDNSHCFSMT